MEKFRKLEEIFMRFPGIGPRQAKRFVYYLMSKPHSYIQEFISLLKEVRDLSTECQTCHRLSLGTNRTKLCSICSDAGRDTRTLIVVARDSDLDSIERAGYYRGLYFVLGGLIPIMDKEPDKKIRLEFLLKYIQKSNGFAEVILSLNTTADGENTANIVRTAIKELCDSTSRQLKITTLGRGLSTGSELEYADAETIKNALVNRK